MSIYSSAFDPRHFTDDRTTNIAFLEFITALGGAYKKGEGSAARDLSGHGTSLIRPGPGPSTRGICERRAPAGCPTGRARLF
jgi:hypothetical protein